MRACDFARGGEHAGIASRGGRRDVIPLRNLGDRDATLFRDEAEDGAVAFGGEHEEKGSDIQTLRRVRGAWQRFCASSLIPCTIARGEWA